MLRQIAITAMFLALACGVPAGAREQEDNTMPETLPYGAWPSPISAAAVVEGGRAMGGLQFDNGALYWLESRPEEGGRTTIMRRGADGGVEEILPPPWNARTRVQEYGGGSMLAASGTVWFSNYEDQRLYRLVPGSDPEPLTPAAALRYAGCVLDAPRERLLCVREDHREAGEARNALVALPLAGGSAGEVLFDAADFVSQPSLSPDGRHVAFTSWRHPNMPWDNTTLWSATFGPDGRLTGTIEHNPASTEAVIDPQWDAQGRLYALSDRNNWWTIYRIEGERFSAVPTGIDRGEIGGPQWSIGHHYYCLLADGGILAELEQEGVGSLVLIDPDRASATSLTPGTGAIYGFLPAAGRLYVIAAPTDSPPLLYETGLQGGARTVIRSAREWALGADWIPRYRLVSFPSGEGAVAHGVYLPPTNPEVSAPAGAAPPLIVSVHGGPTAATSPAFDPDHLYWTSRGFAVLDLNYRGSTGFGRGYRRALYGQWGVYDVEDAVAGARWLAAQGLADPDRLLIRGGSAGGFTTLAALAFYDVFAAGASYFGVSDIEALARDTHKFESRYLDQLIGPYPERRDLYQARSPIHHLEGFNAPLLLLQGLDDPVVPPDQSEKIFQALRSRGVPAAYLAFEGESHGFRRAENQIRSLEAELYFYAKVLGFDTAETLPPLVIEGLDDGTGESVSAPPGKPRD